MVLSLLTGRVLIIGIGHIKEGKTSNNDDYNVNE
jgi:hypothetical protein